MKSVLTMLIFGCAVLLNIYFSDRSSAMEPAWSWTTSTPVLQRSESTTFVYNPYCPTHVQMFKVHRLSNSQTLCLYEGYDFRLGTFSASGFTSQLAIAYPFDDTFSVVDGVCNDGGECIYSSDQDVLLVKYRTSFNSYGLKVYKNVADRIIRIRDIITGQARYLFNADTPTYVLDDIAGQIVPVGALNVSNNGKWVVFEVKGLGFARMNLINGDLIRIAPSGPLYGIGMDPTAEMAISNDGNTVAVMGINAGISLISVKTSCGEPLTGRLEARFASAEKYCYESYIDTNQFIPHFFFGSHPTFDDGGGQLVFYAASHNQGHRKVMLRADKYEKGARLQYLALGDSFNSGEGESDDTFYLMGTNTSTEKCHTSKRSYPYLLAEMIPLSFASVKSVACSGARIGDIYGVDKFYKGQGDRLAGLGVTDLIASQRDAITLFVPGRIYQHSFVSEYEPQVITVGIGGNDAGFMGKLKTCAMPGRCEWASSASALAGTASEIKGLFVQLVALYNELRKNSPYSKIYAVGYPQSINPDGPCDPLTALLLDRDERVFMMQGVVYMNQVIRAAAYEAGITYIDIENSLKGHELCSGSFQPALNGLKMGDDIALIEKLPLLKILGNESFHPTPYGHQLIAQYIHARYQDIRTFSCYLSCGELTSVVMPSPYWPQQIQPDMLPREYPFLPSDWVVREEPTTITLPSGSIAPGSSVRVELHSIPLELGSVVADESGGMTKTITLPEGVVEGYHTIHLYGTTYSGQPVDIYYTVRVEKKATFAARFDTPPTINPTASLRAELPADEIMSIEAPSLLAYEQSKSQDRSNQGVKGEKNNAENENAGTILLISSIGAGILLAILLLLVWRARHRSADKLS